MIVQPCKELCKKPFPFSFHYSLNSEKINEWYYVNINKRINAAELNAEVPCGIHDRFNQAFGFSILTLYPCTSVAGKHCG